MGVTCWQWKKKRANGAEIDDGAINGIKVGSMGTLAAVGDPHLRGTVQLAFAALGAYVNERQPAWSAAVFVRLTGRVWLPAIMARGLCHRKGVDIVKECARFPQNRLRGVNPRPVFCYGALANKWTHVNIPLWFTIGQDGQTRVTTVKPFSTS